MNHVARSFLRTRVSSHMRMPESELDVTLDPLDLGLKDRRQTIGFSRCYLFSVAVDGIQNPPQPS